MFFFFLLPALASLTSGCVSCVGWPTSSSNKGKEANERREEKGLVPREEEVEVDDDVAAADATRAVAAAFDDDAESFAGEAAAAAQRLARSTGRESLRAGAMATESREGIRLQLSLSSHASDLN